MHLLALHIIGFRLTIRNVNILKKEFLSQKDYRFRLTIRNVNRKNYTLSVETIASFRLTIRNVNWIKENLYVVEYEEF